MITKFLYDIDENNKKIISGVVSNEGVEETLKFYPFIEQAKYKEIENDILTPNYGNQIYVVFNDNGIKKYLDVDVVKGSVKINVTDNISYAASMSEEFATTILYNYDYFDLDDCEFISSGFHKNKQGKLTDKYDNFFRKATDGAVCQIRKNNNVYFLASKDNAYYLDTDYLKSAKIVKNDIRKILAVFNIINETTVKQDISFSKFNCFTNGQDYLYIANNPLRISFIDNVLSIFVGPTKILVEDRIVNNEDVSKKLRNISLNLEKPLMGESSYLQCNKHFVSKENNVYKLVSNPVEATLLDELEIKIFKSSMSIFLGECEFTKYSKESLFVYYIDNNIFRFEDEPKKEFNSGLIVNKDVYDACVKSMSSSKDSDTTGVIVIKDDKYLEIKQVSNNEFKILWHDSAYNATVLNEKLVSNLVVMFKWNIQKRSINNLITKNNVDQFNIKVSNDKQDILNNYNEILDEIVKAKHRMCSFTTPSTIKFESPKGALEYLRRFYLKGVYDSKELFNTLLTKYNFINNALIVGPASHLSLIGLNEVTKNLNKKINIGTINHSKWGYYPNVLLNDNITYNEAYRVEFANMVKSIISKYDMILFTQPFNEPSDNVSYMLNDIIADNSNIIIANIKFSNFERQTDPIFNHFKNNFPLKRKMFNHDLNVFNEGTTLNNKAIKNLTSSYIPSNDISEMVVSNENSYQTILVKQEGKIKDFFN